MSDTELPKHARKGTKSCTECRRRKIRCIRTSEDSETCRSCEERGSTCVAQIFSSRPLRAPRLPSRHRIAVLESEVARLRKVVGGIQGKLGLITDDVTEPPPFQPGLSPGEDESDEDSNASDVLATERPAHLRSLFQNDWLSADIGVQDAQLKERKTKASGYLLEHARTTLRKLIPSKEEVLSLGNAARQWVDLVALVLAQPFGLSSHVELVESYDKMAKPDVDTMSLAAWLLDVALTAQQEPNFHTSPAASPGRYQKASDFVRAVSDAVESTLFSHDRLLGTVTGLGMAMHFLRLQISQGNFHKAWIRARHCITLAELLGLSRPPPATQRTDVASSHEAGVRLQRLQLWDFMCSAERLSGMIVNRPPTSRRLEDPFAQPLNVNGVIQTPVYLKRLTDITARFHTLEDSGSLPGASAQAYASALELDRTLRDLASQTTKSWWVQDVVQIKPQNLCQLLHHYFMMRVHLPFTMRQNGEGHGYSRMTCTEACLEVAQRYQILRRLLPSGIFLSPIMDLQALTATVVLLLTTNTGIAESQQEYQVRKARVQETAAQVLKVMQEKSGEAGGANFARQGAITIRALSSLLQHGEGANDSNQLSLKVPLLGNINIRRNSNLAPAPPTTVPPTTTQQHPQIPGGAGLWGLFPQNTAHTFENTPSQGQTQQTAMQEQADWQWNPLSWSIEESNENMFQDVLMPDNWDHFGAMQGDYSNFQMQ